MTEGLVCCLIRTWASVQQRAMMDQHYPVDFLHVLKPSWPPCWSGMYFFLAVLCFYWKWIQPLCLSVFMSSVFLKQRDFSSCVSSILSGNLPHLTFEAPIVSFPEVNLARISQSIFFPIWGRAEINHVLSLWKMHLLEVDINRFFINLIKNSLKTEMEDVVQSTDMSTGTSAWSPMRLTCFHTWQATQFDANHDLLCSSSLAN